MVVDLEDERWPPSGSTRIPLTTRCRVRVRARGGTARPAGSRAGSRRGPGRGSGRPPGGDQPPVGQSSATSSRRRARPGRGRPGRSGRRRRVEQRHRRPCGTRAATPAATRSASPAELVGLGQPNGDVVGGLVGPAARHRVVAGGVDQPPPADVEERLRPAGPVQRRQRLGVAVDQPLGPGHGLLERARAESTPVRMLARALDRSSPCQRGSAWPSAPVSVGK